MKLFASTRTPEGSFSFALVEAATLAEADEVFSAYILGTDETRQSLEDRMFDAVTGESFQDLEVGQYRVVHKKD